MDAGVVLRLSLTIYGIIIAAMFLVVLIVLLLCCYNFNRISPEACDDPELATRPASKESVQPYFELATRPASKESVQPYFELATRPASKESVPPYIELATRPASKESVQPYFELATRPASKESVPPYCSYRPNVHVCHDIPVNRKRTLTPLPNNFHNFITATIIPSFEKQRLIGYQFAVLVLLSEKDFYNICSTTFVPSNGGQPLVDNCHPLMPQNVFHYGNYITARPISNSCHSEEEIFGSSINSHFSQLWSAYVKHNGSPPKCVLLYSWNLPCSRCTDVIIRSLNDSMYSCTSVIVAHTIFWRSESEDEHRINTGKLKKENITVEQVQYPERLTRMS